MALDATKPADTENYVSDLGYYLRETRAYLNALELAAGGGDGSDGADAEFVYVIGAQVFKFTAGIAVPTPATIVLTAALHGILTDYLWQYWNGSAWANLSGTNDEETYSLTYNNAAWGTDKTLRVRCVSDGEYDEITMVKLYDGESGYTVILTNETHAINCNSSGVPEAGELGDGGKASCGILVYRGIVQLAPVAEAATPGANEYRYNIGTPLNGTAARTDNETFYLATATADSGNVPITVYCEGLTVAITKLFTFTKARAGVDGVDGADGADGAAGVGSRTVNLTAAALGFVYDTEGANPSPGSAVVTATALNTVGTPYYNFFLNDVSVQHSTAATYTYTPQAAHGNMPDKIEVELREDATDNPILARDQITMVGLKTGGDGITTLLTNEAHALPVNQAGTVDYTDSGTDIQVWIGSTALPYGSGAGNPYFEVAAAVTSGTVTIGSASTPSSNVRRFAAHSAMTTDKAIITFTITVVNSAGASFTITKVQTLVKSHDGADGADGSDGPGLAFRGNWATGTAYIGTAYVKDVVKNGATYYICQSSHTSGVWADDLAAGKWVAFGASFTSVATDLLLAQDVYITKRLYFTGGDSQIVVTADSALEIDSESGIKLLGAASIYMDEPDSVECTNGRLTGGFVEFYAQDHGIITGDRIIFHDADGVAAGWDSLESSEVFLAKRVDDDWFYIKDASTGIALGTVGFDPWTGSMYVVKVTPSAVVFKSEKGMTTPISVSMGTAPGYWKNGLFFWPSTAFEGRFAIGVNPGSNDWARFDDVYIAADSIVLQYDAGSASGVTFVGYNGSGTTQTDSEIAFTKAVLRLQARTAEPSTANQGIYGYGNEVKVIDVAGNKTTISPHNFELFEPPVEQESPWTYSSENSFLGKQVTADMYGALKAIEKIYEEVFQEQIQLIFLKDIPKLDWEEEQDKLEIAYNEQLAKMDLIKRRVMPKFERREMPKWVKKRLDYEKSQKAIGWEEGRDE